MGVHDQDVVAIDDDRRIAVQHGRAFRDRAVDTVSDLLEIEEPGRRGAGCGRLFVGCECTDRRSPPQAARGRGKPGGLQLSEDLATRGQRRFEGLVASVNCVIHPASDDGGT